MSTPQTYELGWLTCSYLSNILCPLAKRWGGQKNFLLASLAEFVPPFSKPWRPPENICCNMLTSQSKVDHPRMHAFSYVRITCFCFCDLDLDPINLTQIFWIAYIPNITFLGQNCLSKVRARTGQTHRDRQTRSSAIPRRICGRQKLSRIGCSLYFV